MDLSLVYYNYFQKWGKRPEYFVVPLDELEGLKLLEDENFVRVDGRDEYMGVSILVDPFRDEPIAVG